MTSLRLASGPARLAACLAGGAALLASVAGVAPAFAQSAAQPTQGSEATRLSTALTTLARDPNSVPALIAAGEASFKLDNVDAALGFFRRAQALVPGDGRVKAGLAAVMVRQNQPLEALRLFAEAEQGGALTVDYVAERGLAYDLAGDNVRAQSDYALALSAGPDPAITRRLALSQAIAGDQGGSETTLLPLLQRSELAAYRTRAFALAIVGKAEEAVSIAQTMLPEPLSGRLAPYLRYMPRLTRAQQAAAANLGSFPPAAEIGRDNPALAAFAAQAAPAASAPAAAAAGSRLVPSGPPLGGAAPRPAVQAPAQAAVAPTPVPRPAPAPAPAAAVATPPAQTGLAQSVAAPAPVTVATLAPAPTQASAPVSSPQPAAPAPRPAVGLSEAFAEFRSADAAPAAMGPGAGAVDIAAIQPRREQPVARPAPAPPPPVASRHWVQVATGRDTRALAFDWRRIQREAGGLLDAARPHTAVWGQSNRLVAGPFPSAATADQLIARLKDKQVDAFRFTSATGEEVKPLG